MPDPVPDLTASDALYNPSRIYDNAAALVAARASGHRIAALPFPATTAEAFRVQDAVTEQLVAPIGGWKCGLPGNGRVFAAPIYRADIQSAAMPIMMTDAGIKYEPELAFTLAHDLSRGATRADVITAIGEIRLAVETLLSRFRDIDSRSPDDLLADNLMNQGLVLGPAIDWADITRVQEIVIAEVGKVRRHAAAHPAGDPLAPLLWLANHGPQPLRSGETIITGSFIPAALVVADTEIEIGYGPIGSMTLRFQCNRTQP